VTISPDGKLLASGGYDSLIKVRRLSNGDLLHILSGHSASVNSVAISADGMTIVSGSEDKTIRLWRLE